ncbi:mechanosensitive ion channel family protein [Haloferax sp. Q22]|uniref:mechanosensitive ion channel family protein n=1 Tax=Haloferax sp. (strain Q22) TaxID=1526048 RepID=UPI000737B976|nr:mechanosensitive ion channel family protein [Haloferax sp. Q22]
MTLPALAAVLLRLASTGTLLQSGTVLDTASLFPTFELRVAASVLVTVAVVAVWRLGARLHDKEVDFVSMPVWHLSVTVLRLVVVGGGGAFVFTVWSLSGDIGTISAQYDLNRQTFVRIVLSLAFVVGAYVLTTVLGRFIGEIASTRPEISDHQREIIYRIAQVTTYLATLAVILGIWRADLGGFLVGAGFLGIVVGMAARQTLGALIAGFVIMFSRPFEIGDWVEVGDHEGIVTEITVVNTRIQTFDGEFVMIPNDVVSSESLVNRSRKGRLRLDVEVGVDYETDLDRAADVAQSAVEDLDEVLSVPKPQVVAKQFGDSAVVLGVRPWIDRPSARRWWRARTATISAVSEAFAEEDITIPFPQRELSERNPSRPVPLTDQQPEASPEADGGVEDGEGGDGDASAGSKGADE